VAEKTTKEQVEELEKVVVGYLGKAMEMRLDLGTEDYDLAYIESKLKQCAYVQEQLSDVAMALVRLSLGVSKKTSQGRSLLKIEVAQLTAQPTYLELPPTARESYLQRKTEVLRKEVDLWTGLSSVVSEVKGAIGERVQAIKRLDSDIRQYQRLLEVKGPSGATGPVMRTGARGKDLQL